MKMDYKCRTAHNSTYDVTNSRYDTAMKQTIKPCTALNVLLLLRQLKD